MTPLQLQLRRDFPLYLRDVLDLRPAADGTVRVVRKPSMRSRRWLQIAASQLTAHGYAYGWDGDDALLVTAARAKP